MKDKLVKLDDILSKDIEREVDKIITAGTINPTEVKTVTDAICLMLKSLEFGEWLQDGEGMGSSYRRGRSPVTGRYVSRSMDPYSMSMHDGSYGGRAYNMDMYDRDYSGHSIKDRMIAKLETMVDMAKSDYERQEVMNAIRTINSMN